jgi:hypothetical protein
MIRFGAGYRLVFVTFLALGATARADTPAAEPAPLAALQAMVGNLGYATTTADDKQAFSITWSGNYDYEMHFYLSKDGTLGYAYVQLTTLTPGQLAKMQYIKMLEADDVGDFFFSMEKSDTGEHLYANAIIPLSGMTPPYLRSILEGWVSKMDASDNLWDPHLWK